MADIFQQRSGRVIALSRALLASFFTLAIVLDPGQSGAQAATVVLLLSGYVLFSGLIFFLTWNNWWLEARLALVAHAVDLGVFVVLVLLTQGYVSPFFPVYVFLVLSSTVRGGWREALVTTALVVILFVAAAMISASGPAGVRGLEVQRLVARGAQLIVVSLMIIWFGVSRLGSRSERVPVVLEDTAETALPVRQVLEHVRRRLDAARVVLAWGEADEPWLSVSTLDADDFGECRFGPDEFPDPVRDAPAKGPFLFDAHSGNVLFARSGRREMLTDAAPVLPTFAARFGIATGLAIPVNTDACAGYILALDIPVLSSDDLGVADRVGQEVATAFERATIFAATREAAATRTRLLLARDLHDSVVQFLAGMRLKLEALKRVAGTSDVVTHEIDELQQQLVHEQADLRGLISALSHPGPPLRTGNLIDLLASLKLRLERQWEIDSEFRLDPSLAIVSASLHHHVEQMVREGVANAVRHGGATRVTIDAAAAEGRIVLSIADDGQGFPLAGTFDDAELRARRIGPRSLHERVSLLGGTMGLRTDAGAGSRLTLAIPVEGAKA